MMRHAHSLYTFAHISTRQKLCVVISHNKPPRAPSTVCCCLNICSFDNMYSVEHDDHHFGSKIYARTSFASSLDKYYFWPWSSSLYVNSLTFSIWVSFQWLKSVIQCWSTIKVYRIRLILKLCQYNGIYTK